MDVKIRNVSAEVVLKINEIARNKKISREELLRRYLKQLALEEDLSRTEDRYESLVRLLIDRLEENNQVMQEVVDKIGYINGEIRNGENI